MAPRTRGGCYRQNRTAERATGFEPVTSSLGSWHSTPELRPQNAFPSNGKTYRNLHAHPRTRKPRQAQPRLYRQATTLGCSTFSSTFSLNSWLAFGSSVGTSWDCVATTFPFASRKSNVILSGADALGRKFVICPSRLTPFSVTLKLDTVISTGSESATCR